jgi:hypothetical protein
MPQGRVDGYGQQSATPAPVTAPVQRAPTPARTSAAAVFAPRPLETPEEKAAREAREALLTGTGNAYIAPGQATYAPEGAATSYGTKPGDARYDEHRNSDAWTAEMTAARDSGNILPGAYYGQNNQKSTLRPELSTDEANAKRARDFGLGAANNAETAAMIGSALATGNKYSSAFGDVAGSAGAASAAAQARGLGMYGGDTGQYQQGLDNAQRSRGMQVGAYDQLMNFARAPQGPSAAQAQLREATDANTQNALAMARSGRGMGGSQAALRQALVTNAGTQQSAASQAAALRANEYTAYQQQRLAALNTAGGVAGQTVQGDQNYGQLGLAGAQYQTDTALKGTQLNDAAAQAWADRQNAALQQGMGAEMGAQTQGLNINATALAGRENEYASANQTYAAEKGFAQAAAIADANRQQAYTAAGINAAGTVMGALSDERAKTNIMPLGSMGGNDVKPLPSQSGGSVFGATPVKMGPTGDELAEQQRSARGEAIGGGAGKVVGAAAGSAVAGPIGGIAGSLIGGVAGKAIGKVFSDIRNKTNVRSLDPEPRVAPGGGLSASGEYLHGDFSAGRRKLDRDAFGNNGDPIDALGAAASKYGPKYGAAFDQLNALASKYGAAGVAAKPKAVSEYTKLKPEQEKGFASWLKKNNVRDLDHPDSHYDYRGAYAAGEGRGAGTGHFTDRFKQHGHPTFSTESQYSASGKDGGSWVGDEPEAPRGSGAATARRFARDDSHPILSEGDALLADSARNAPGSMYEYKDPEAPGAAPGTQTGPMAQDLAAHPVTRGMVGKDKHTGKLFVDGSRAALTGLAQNHAQQNHIDALGARINELEDMLPAALKRKKGDERATSFSTSTGGF